MVDSPVQLNPSPSKPSLHVQQKLPSVSVQLALEWHGYVSSSHSLISADCDHCKNVATLIVLQSPVVSDLTIVNVYQFLINNIPNMICKVIYKAQPIKQLTIL